MNTLSWKVGFSEPTSPGFHRVYKSRDASRRYKGIAIVSALHILFFWGIVSGTARNALVVLKKPLEAVVIQEVIIPPPPPPPPKEIIKALEAPKVDAPPPPFLPPPEVATPVTQAPTIVAQATPPVTAPVIAPPVLVPPPVTVPVHTGPSNADIGVSCPTQVRPDYPSRAKHDEIEGIVKAQVLIKDGVVKEVTILSGPRVFHAAVREAIMQYKCISAGEVITTQSLVFKLD